MPRRLDASAADFAQAFESLVAAKRAGEADVDAAVAAILADVKARGDAALLDYTARFDRLNLAAAGLRLPAVRIEAALSRAPAPAVEALRLAARRIADYHKRQLPAGFEYEDADGIRLGARWTPIDSAGLYVPGGTAAYPSSVLMNAIPAKVAGVGRLAMVVPTPDGKLNDLVLAAAHIAGVDEIYRIGGAQAVAALAYGTATVPRVDKIVGPGNAYVAAAKKLVFGTVGIDLIAGPSEILVVADNANDPTWIAADLLSQAEHDEAAQAILITDDSSFASQVAAAVDRHLERLPRAAIARTSWQRYGALIVVRTLDDAPALVDRLAPEHLELAVADPAALARRIRHAGAIFMGRHAPEAIGDYVAGPNHVLPTSQSARFSSGLGVLDFMKRTSLIGCGAAGLAAIGPAAIALAEAEGLGAHALSVAIRLADPGPGGTGPGSTGPGSTGHGGAGHGGADRGGAGR
jgi:histidinol dehydrogenase